MINFTYDPNKAQLNLAKHGIGFDEAISVFYDDYAVQFFDTEHSDDEDRFIMLGMSNQAKLLIVCHCERENGIIRIISARKATKTESTHHHRP